jgi:hypothetical protein
MINNPLAIRAGIAHIILGVVRVLLQVAAIRQAGVDIGDALVVGDKIDALANPHRSGEVAVGRFEPLKLPVAFVVDPEHAGGAAPIAFPAGRVARMSAQ